MTFIVWSNEAAESLLLPLRDEPGPVLVGLQIIQKNFGYVSEEAAAFVADYFNVSRADVHGVLTFYHDFRRTPPPKNCIQICVAEACQAVGSRALVSAVTKKFATAIDTPHSDLEIKSAYCFGNCALGPATMVNGALMGRSDVEKISKALL